jgi:hypothetical protein
MDELVWKEGDRVRLLDHGRRLSIWCQGCKDLHVVPIDGTRDWRWNGDRVNPTVTPSLMSHHTGTDGKVSICHLFITNGNLVFLSDSEHEFSGQTVPLDSPQRFFAHD